MKMKTNELVKIFYSESVGHAIDFVAIDQIQQLLEDSVMDFLRFQISSKGLYLHYLEILDAGEIQVIELGGSQREGHLALKMIAKEYLSNSGRKADYEVNHRGNVVDVVAKDFSIFIECGNTDPNKVREYLADPRVKEVGILPYPKYEDDTIILIRFLRGKYFGQYLKSTESCQAEELKQLVADLGDEL